MSRTFPCETGDESGSAFPPHGSSPLQHERTPATSPFQWSNLNVDTNASDMNTSGGEQIRSFGNDGEQGFRRMDRYSYSTTGRSSMPSLHSPFGDNSQTNSQTRLIPGTSPVGPSSGQHNSYNASHLSTQQVIDFVAHAKYALSDMTARTGPESPSGPSREKFNAGAGGKAEDPNLVTWYENDTDDPKNWPISKKWRVTLLVSLASFLSMFTSAMVAPAGTTIAAEFEIGQTTTIVIVSIFVLGFAIGPFYIAPMSEVYGRMAVLQSSMSLFLIFNVACAISTNEAQLIAFRFLSGIGGSAALVLGGGILTDIWSRETMGKASGIYHLAPLVGPPMGPLVSAFIVSATSWRWIFGAVSIACATFQVMALFFLPETYGPTILRRRMQRLKVQTGNPNLVLESDNNLLAALRISIVRPFLLLSTQPIVQVIALYMAYIFGLFYLLIASFPRVWIGQYGQSTSIAGLNYLSLGIGYIIGALSNARISDRILKKLTQKNGGRPKPEFRIPTMFVGSWLMPLGLFWYGFSANAKAHWIVPNLGMVVFSAGSVLCIEAMQTYIFDSYRRFAASALAAAIIARSIAGFAVPLASPALYDDLGIGWGTAVLAFIGIGIGIPAPFIFWFFGERLRKMSQYAAG